MWLLGLVVGIWAGSMLGVKGMLLGGVTGAILGKVYARINKAQQVYADHLKRLNEIFARLNQLLDVLEQAQRGGAAGKADASATPVHAPAQASAQASASEPQPENLAPIAMAQNYPHALSSSPTATQSVPAAQARKTALPAAWQQDSEQYSAPEPYDFSSLTSSPLWQKLFGGNILAKIGVVLLFFGVASGLKLAADYGMFPVQVRLLLAAVGAVAMIMFGWSRAAGEKHRMFGFALQGGGFAILYLIVYFMLVRYQMLGPQLAFVLFTLLGVGCLLVAAKLDSVSLAVLGISGAFLSPVLADAHSGNHIALFSYFALLNTLIIGVNWFKSWRELNVTGFLFTFAIGMSWALRSYRDEYMFSTELFLILFFLMYSLVPVMFTLFDRAGKPGWGDGLLLFGTPLAAVFCQQTLMRPYEYAIEITALLERDPLLVQQEQGRYHGSLLLPWGYGVVFTNITRKQFEAAELGQARDQAIRGHGPLLQTSTTGLRRFRDGEVFQKRMWGMFNYSFGGVLSLARIDRVRWHLFPDIRRSGPCPRIAWSRAWPAPTNFNYGISAIQGR